METDSYITIDLRGFLTIREWRFKNAFRLTKKWICTNLLLANMPQQPTWITYSFNTKCLSLHNILYYVERGNTFQSSLSFHGWSRGKGNYQMPGCISRDEDRDIKGRGGRAWRDDGCPRRLSGSVMFKCCLSVGFLKTDLDRSKFVFNWLKFLFFLLVVVVVISK